MYCPSDFLHLFKPPPPPSHLFPSSVNLPSPLVLSVCCVPSLSWRAFISVHPLEALQYTNGSSFLFSALNFWSKPTLSFWWVRQMSSVAFKGEWDPGSVSDEVNRAQTESNINADPPFHQGTQLQCKEMINPTNVFPLQFFSSFYNSHKQVIEKHICAWRIPQITLQLKKEQEIKGRIFSSETEELVCKTTFLCRRRCQNLFLFYCTACLK